MKKILLFSFLTYFISLGLFAQSLELNNSYGPVANGDTVVMATTLLNQTQVMNVNVKNISSSDVNVKVKKTELNMVSGSDAYFCWASCYAPSIFISPDPLTISANTSAPNFTGDYEDNGNAGTSWVRYTFFLESKPSDTVCFVIKYIAGSGVGIDDASPKVEVSNIFPNPANNKVSVNYDLNGATNAQLEIRNILGSVVKSVELTNTNGQVSIDVSDLTNGVYFYSFMVNEVAVKTTKLVIQH